MIFIRESEHHIQINKSSKNMALDKTLFYIHVQKYYNFDRIDLPGTVIISSDNYECCKILFFK